MTVAMHIESVTVNLDRTNCHLGPDLLTPT